MIAEGNDNGAQVERMMSVVCGATRLFSVCADWMKKLVRFLVHWALIAVPVALANFGGYC
jgi:hypothetical protein